MKRLVPIKSQTLRDFVFERIREVVRRKRLFLTWRADRFGEDAYHAGIVAFLELEKSVEGKSQQGAWEKIAPVINRAVRFALDSEGHSPIASLDAINASVSADREEGQYNLLDSIDGATEARLYLGNVPNDPGTRMAIIVACEAALDRLRCKNTGIYNTANATFRAQVNILGRSIGIGDFKSKAEAKSALKFAYRGLKERCYPIDPVGNSNNSGGSYLLKMRQTAQFWRNVAKDHGCEHALPAFMYWNPEELMIFLEALSGEAQLDSAYDLTSDSAANMMRLKAERKRSSNTMQVRV